MTPMVRCVVHGFLLGLPEESLLVGPPSPAQLVHRISKLKEPQQSSAQFDSMQLFQPVDTTENSSVIVTMHMYAFALLLVVYHHSVATGPLGRSYVNPADVRVLESLDPFPAFAFLAGLWDMRGRRGWRVEQRELCISILLLYRLQY